MPLAYLVPREGRGSAFWAVFPSLLVIVFRANPGAGAGREGGVAVMGFLPARVQWGQSTGQLVDFAGFRKTLRNLRRSL